MRRILVILLAVVLGACGGGDAIYNDAAMCNLSGLKKEIAAGVNVNRQSKSGYTALIMLYPPYPEKKRERLPCITEGLKLLLAAGANPSLQDDRGGTVLMGAALSGHAEGVEILLQAGADRALKDGHGRTASDYAAGQGWTELAARLR